MKLPSDLADSRGTDLETFGKLFGRVSHHHRFGDGSFSDGECLKPSLEVDSEDHLVRY